MWSNVLVATNLLGGTIAVAAVSASATPDPIVFATRHTYLLGLFLVNGWHGVMHVAVGLFGLYLVWNGREQRFWAAHTAWFTLLGLWGLGAVRNLEPSHTLAGLAVNLPDHLAHLVLAVASAVPLLLRGASATRHAAAPSPSRFTKR